VWVMRIRALTCGLLQHSQVWTQNPPSSFSWGFDSPSRHQSKVSKSNKLALVIPPFHFAPFLPLEGWCMLGVVCGRVLVPLTYVRLPGAHMSRTYAVVRATSFSVSTTEVSKQERLSKRSCLRSSQIADAAWCCSGSQC
jgi:hypothetical protein